MTKTQNKSTNALHVFLAKKQEFDTLVAELAKASDDHFFTGPNEVNWGNVGDFERWLKQLRDVTDSIHRRGEYSTVARFRSVPPAR